MNKILNGDCRNIMAEMEANSIDCVVTDPPYGLGFMGKEWDKGIPGNIFWMEALRVMKPGAYLLAFGGTRTFHRLTCAIEDAGFEIRDCMMWLYGSGFPKSHDVSKAIDKAAEADRNILGVAGKSGSKRNAMAGDFAGGEYMTTAPATDAAKQWSGWGTALKPAWEPIIVARKPLEGTVAENVLKWGCGAMNINASKIDGTFKSAVAYGKSTARGGYNDGFGSNGNYVTPPSGRWPANVILDEEAGEMLDGCAYDSSTIAQGPSRFFYCAKASKKERNAGLEGMQESPNMRVNAPRENELAKHSSVMANNHPTVKPISLLQYLIKLVCPPNGIVLDPFMGSGSTMVAASRLGFKSIGIELEETYCEIARKRVDAEMLPLEVAVNE